MSSYIHQLLAHPTTKQNVLADQATC